MRGDISDMQKYKAFETGLCGYCVKDSWTCGDDCYFITNGIGAGELPAEAARELLNDEILTRRAMIEGMNNGIVIHPEGYALDSIYGIISDIKKECHDILLIARHGRPRRNEWELFLLNRNWTETPWVVCWNYDKFTNSWHWAEYCETLAAALSVFVRKCEEHNFDDVALGESYFLESSDKEKI